MKNKLIAIGSIGDFNCYLNISEEEACKRYIAESDYYGTTVEEVMKAVKVIEFDDEFWSYLVSASN